jgi:hypothetical protein
VQKMQGYSFEQRRLVVAVASQRERALVQQWCEIVFSV